MSLPNDLSIEDRRAYCKATPKLVAMFGQDLVDEGLRRFTMTQLVEVMQIPLKDAEGRPLPDRECWHKPHQFLRNVVTHHRFVDARGWEKAVSTPVKQYMIPYHYQHTYEAQHIIRPAMEALFPWIKPFKLSIYDVGYSENPEFYVDLPEAYKGHKALYVPYKAFAEGDVEAIIKRNETYLRDYTKSDEVWKSMSQDPVVIAFLLETEANSVC